MMPFRGTGARSDTYRNFQKLPEGSTVLYRAENIIFGKDFVQKWVRVTAGSVAFQEPRLLKEFEHPHITPVLEAQFDPESPDLIVMIMPLYEGGSVARALVDGHRFSLHEAMAIIRNGLDALDYTHVRHLVAHRDVKPGNILLDRDRTEGFLADFGAAASFEKDGKAPWVSPS
jgi:serine/threonine protein kinase